MKAEEWYTIGARLLGTYFVVIGVLALPGALFAVGVQTLPEQRLWPLIVHPLLQAGIALVAGAVLISRGGQLRGEPGHLPLDANALLVAFLQLAGVLLLVEGLAEAAGGATEMWSFSEAWQLRLSKFVAAAVRIALALVLITRPRRVAEQLLLRQKFGA